MRLRQLWPILGVAAIAVATSTAFVMHDAPLPTAVGLRADQVIVDKSERRLDLLANGKVVASFLVALGGNPVGHKQREGDSRTPEGAYILDWRNPNSRFHVSYPDAQDEARAQAAGVPPGGDIMIHGHGFGWPWLLPFDWTDGCIAVANSDMDVIWAAVPDGTPIEIRP
jgi:murein L,D-transpeptidase YafK